MVMKSKNAMKGKAKAKAKAKQPKPFSAERMAAMDRCVAEEAKGKGKGKGSADEGKGKGKGSAGAGSRADAASPRKAPGSPADAASPKKAKLSTETGSALDLALAVPEESSLAQAKSRAKGKGLKPAAASFQVCAGLKVSQDMLSEDEEEEVPGGGEDEESVPEAVALEVVHQQCMYCHKPIFQGQAEGAPVHVKSRHEGSAGNTYHCHSGCRLMNDAFRTCPKGKDNKLSWDEKVNFYYKHDGISSAIATNVQAYFEQKRLEVNRTTASKEALGVSATDLGDRYLTPCGEWEGRTAQPERYAAIIRYAPKQYSAAQDTWFYFPEQMKLTHELSVEESDLYQNTASQDGRRRPGAQPALRGTPAQPAIQGAPALPKAEKPLNGAAVKRLGQIKEGWELIMKNYNEVVASIQWDAEAYKDMPPTIVKACHRAATHATNQILMADQILEGSLQLSSSQFYGECSAQQDKFKAAKADAAKTADKVYALKNCIAMIDKAIEDEGLENEGAADAKPEARPPLTPNPGEQQTAQPATTPTRWPGSTLKGATSAGADTLLEDVETVLADEVAGQQTAM